MIFGAWDKFCLLELNFQATSAIGDSAPLFFSYFLLSVISMRIRVTACFLRNMVVILAAAPRVSVAFIPQLQSQTHGRTAAQN